MTFFFFLLHPTTWQYLIIGCMLAAFGTGWYFEVNELILLEEEQARRALEEERMRMEEHARQREQMIGGPPRGMEGGGVFVCV